MTSKQQLADEKNFVNHMLTEGVMFPGATLHDDKSQALTQHLERQVAQQAEAAGDLNPLEHYRPREGSIAFKVMQYFLVQDLGFEISTPDLCVAIKIPMHNIAAMLYPAFEKGALDKRQRGKHTMWSRGKKKPIMPPNMHNPYRAENTKPTLVMVDKGNRIKTVWAPTPQPLPWGIGADAFGARA